MVLALGSHVVGGVEVEEEELLAESDGAEELSQGVACMIIMRKGTVEEEGEEGVGEEGEGDGGVFEVVEVVGGDGAVGVEGLVVLGSDEELHGDGGGGARHDEEELEVAELGGGEPGRGGVGSWVEEMKLHVFEEMP